MDTSILAALRPCDKLSGRQAFAMGTWPFDVALSGPVEQEENFRGSLGLGWRRESKKRPVLAPALGEA